MRSVPVPAAVIIGLAALISGCGQRAGSGAAAPAPAASRPASVAVCRGAQPAKHASKLTITAADNGESLCVSRGTNVAVFLKGTPTRKWEPIQASSAVLRSSANGERTLPIGVTGASFAAAQPGTAVITSGRPVCGPAAPPQGSTPGTGGSGTVECGAILAFRVTVTVVR